MSSVGRSESPTATRPAPPARTNPSDSGSLKKVRSTLTCTLVRFRSAIPSDPLDEGLPSAPHRSWQEHLVPPVDEERSVDDRLDVARPALSKHDFVCLQPLASVGEPNLTRGARPVEVDGQAGRAKSLCRGEARQVIGHERDAATANGNLKPLNRRSDGELVAGHREKPLERVDCWRYAPMLIRRHGRPRRSGTTRQLCDRHASLHAGCRKQGCLHGKSVSDQIRMTARA